MITRWKRAVLARLSRIHDLVRVLMKPRNGEAWSEEDKAFLWREVRAVARWTPALVLFLLPGSALLLPLLAWTLDRRRGTMPAALPVDRRRPGGWVT